MLQHSLILMKVEVDWSHACKIIFDTWNLFHYTVLKLEQQIRSRQLRVHYFFEEYTI